MKVAIIHYWLVNLRGGESVVEALCEIFPQADIITHVFDPAPFSDSIISKHKIITTFIDRLPLSKKYYQKYLPLMPMALEQVNLQDYDLIISSESGPAKGIVPPPGIPHICYCHSPMRYVWDMYHDYMKEKNFLMRLVSAPLMHYLRRWDQLTSTQVTKFIANSNFVASRIKTFYGRESSVIHPPVDIDRFEPLNNATKDYYLIFGQLVSYKRVDLAIEAFNKSGKKLIVAGDGEERQKLEAIANDNITFTGKVPPNKVKALLQNAKALLFPGTEDFGIVPVEAMACGTPVIAYAAGGALDTVVHLKTGILYEDCSPDGLNSAIHLLNRSTSLLDTKHITNHAKKFSREIFKSQLSKTIKEYQTRDVTNFRLEAKFYNEPSEQVRKEHA